MKNYASNSDNLNSMNEKPVNNTDHLLTKNVQYSGAETATEVLPAVVGKHYQIHDVTINTNSTTDADLVSGATLIFYLNAPSAAASASSSRNGGHLDCPSNTNIEITCGAGTFISIVYHVEDD